MSLLKWLAKHLQGMGPTDSVHITNPNLQYCQCCTRTLLTQQSKSQHFLHVQSCAPHCPNWNDTSLIPLYISKYFAIFLTVLRKVLTFLIYSVLYTYTYLGEDEHSVATFLQLLEHFLQNNHLSTCSYEGTSFIVTSSSQSGLLRTQHMISAQPRKNYGLTSLLTSAAAGMRYGWLQHFLSSIIRLISE